MDNKCTSAELRNLWHCAVPLEAALTKAKPRNICARSVLYIKAGGGNTFHKSQRCAAELAHATQFSSLKKPLLSRAVPKAQTIRRVTRHGIAPGGNDNQGRPTLFICALFNGLLVASRALWSNAPHSLDELRASEWYFDALHAYQGPRPSIYLTPEIWQTVSASAGFVRSNETF